MTPHTTATVSRKHGRGRGRRRLAPLLRDGAEWVRLHPLTVAVAAALLILNALTAVWQACAGAPFPPLAARLSFDGVQAGDAVSVPLSLVFVAHPARIVLDTVAVLVAGGFAESRLGRRKTVLTALVCGIGGVAVGLLASVVVNGRSPLWQRLADLGVVLGPLCLAVGPLMAASAFETVLWRRRIRLIAYAVVGMFVLYRGETGDWCALAAAVLGHVVGYLMVPRQDTESLAHATMFEARRIIACLGAVMALGPVIAVSSPIHAGPLSTLGLLMGDADVDPDRLRSCLDSAASVDCFAQYRLLRVSMPGSVLVSFLPVLFLLAVAYGLYRGRRIAARVALAVNGAIVVLSSLYFLVLPMAQTDGGMRGLMMHGAVRSVVATAVPPLLCIAVVLAWMRCFRLRTRPRVAAAAGGAVLAFVRAIARPRR
ncbi:hypothetical protein H7U32_01755 [Bifidobacterium pullorum subsp. saeculare]|uniref:Uncharacterized protein n=1 Tax=Bifidobacterium pullorum subsp. saeculare TaxID=78257 RepID=A0A938WYP0_9BIFI|nr:hypothetical protein [Bifidobacterium pullorum]MBM6699072.1 hypothetical protein [Bifidobacterium pullorum subsp. saeculare]